MSLARTGILVAIGFAVVALSAACNGSSSAKPEATATIEVTAAAARSSATPEPTNEQQIKTTEPITTSRCPDPYASGAPYQPTPGQPLRLRPTGSAPGIARFETTAVVPDPALDRVVRDSMGVDSSHFAVVIKNLSNGTGVAISPDRVFYAASLYKTWVMLEAYHQRDAGILALDEEYVVSDYYDKYRLNADELRGCSQVSAIDALRAMMSVSDNVAANLMYDRVGYTTTNQTLRDLGLTRSGLVAGGDLTTTAGDMELLFEAFACGKAVSPGASEEMIALLESELINDRIPALLPEGIPVAHKTGNWDNATHDVGIVYSPKATYVISVLTDFGFDDDGAGRIARLSKAVYDYYNPG